ncbi:hypothetical protein GRI89_07185 [Altererythrobacter salegens]|uniref:Lipoprotein n=1 Tax=Croceibacterium salegens TaxID=1737568 RepID=A0A6I4STZ3_9SPHN|nr:hypothetical protein [Croceibacterium salegens]MXO59323.1 hypothetical protein [Croceibacterium salegens]
MTALRLLIALPIVALAACVPSAPAPTPAPTPAPAPPPTQAPEEVVAPTPSNWMDAPQTAGDWSYVAYASGSSASFGVSADQPRFAIACVKASRTIALMRFGRAAAPVPMTIRTEFSSRTFTAEPKDDGQPTIRTELPARDSFLDAIAFSKGRFSVEMYGLDTLYLPSWPEISRVLDDCR